MDDVLFTFDILPFQNAMKTMNKGINSFIKKIALIGAGFLSIKKAMSFMPEIGRSFEIAGNIIGRNLLNPLRKELIPLLQSMLDWVRDHRAMFVRWGTYLVSIFKTIKVIVTGFIDLLNRMWERLSGNLERIFGGTAKKMSEIVNLILFKLSAVASFIMILLEPVFDFIVDSFTNMLLYASNFFSGFTEGIGDIFGPLEDLITMLADIGRYLGILDHKTGSLTNTFKSLGAVVGGAVRGAILALAQTIDTITIALKTLVGGIKIAKAFITGNKEEAKKIKEDLAKDLKSFGERSMGRGRDVKETYSRVKTAVVREMGGSKQTTNTTNLNVDPITVNVTEGDAKKAGEDFGKGLQEKLIDEDVLSGGRR